MSLHMNTPGARLIPGNATCTTTSPIVTLLSRARPVLSHSPRPSLILTPSGSNQPSGPGRERRSITPSTRRSQPAMEALTTFAPPAIPTRTITPCSNAPHVTVVTTPTIFNIRTFRGTYITALIATNAIGTGRADSGRAGDWPYSCKERSCRRQGGASESAS